MIIALALLPVVTALYDGEIYTQEELDELDFDNEQYYRRYVHNSLRYTAYGLAMDWSWLYIDPLEDGTYIVRRNRTTWMQNGEPITFRWEYFRDCECEWNDQQCFVDCIIAYFISEGNRIKGLIIESAKSFQSAPFEFDEGDFGW